jgi:hypothetical protein
MTEAPELGGTRWVDLVLERGEIKIAVEASVTTSVDREVGNILKCLDAGYKHVAVVSSSNSKLRKIESAAIGVIKSEQRAYVHFHSPDSFISSIQTLEYASRLASQSIVKDSRGYNVRRSVSSSRQGNQQETALFNVLAKALKG